MHELLHINFPELFCMQGSNVKALEADTGAKVVVRDEGIVNLYAPTKDKYTAAETLLETFTGADVKVDLLTAHCGTSAHLHRVQRSEFTHAASMMGHDPWQCVRCGATSKTCALMCAGGCEVQGASGTLDGLWRFCGVAQWLPGTAAHLRAGPPQGQLLVLCKHTPY